MATTIEKTLTQTPISIGTVGCSFRNLTGQSVFFSIGTEPTDITKKYDYVSPFDSVSINEESTVYAWVRNGTEVIMVTDFA
jgi:hypothetical protein